MNFHDHLSAAQQRVIQTLQAVLADTSYPDSRLSQAMSYSLLSGGKRLRPFLIYASGAMLGIKPEQLDIPAAAVECIHCYSLIHDDLPAMDDDDLRRGKPTCHIAFDQATAILAGDALQTLAFELLASAPIPDVSATSRLAIIAELAKSSGHQGMCAGQALDLQAEGQSISLPQLERIHQHKTGTLIRSSVRIAALCGGDNTTTLLPLLDQYSAAIGLAFQVQDDILDVVGDCTITGKQAGADNALAKSTYPSLLGLAGAQNKATLLHQQAITALQQLSAQGFNTEILETLASYIIKRDK